MQQNRRPMSVLFVSLFLVMVGFGIIIPVMPFYVRQFGGSAAVLGLLMASYSLMQFFCAPLWGRLSDRIGRRPVFLLGLCGYGISFILYGLSSSLWMLFFSRILAGIVSSATLPTAMAYVADVTTKEDRSKGMGLMGAAMGLGMIFGPALGGLLAQTSLSLPFFVAGAFALLNIPFALKWLPESLPASARQTKETQPPMAPRFSRETLEHPLLPLFWMAFAVSGSMSMFESTFALFSADRLAMTTRDMGIMFASLGMVGVYIQLKVLSRLVARFGDLPVMMGGVLMTAVGFLLMLGAWNMPSMWVTCLVFSVGSTLLRPSVSTLVTKVTQEGQGISVGRMQSFDSLGRICGPLAGGAAYELSSSAPNIIGSIFLVALLAVCWPRLLRLVPQLEPEPEANQLPEAGSEPQEERAGQG